MQWQNLTTIENRSKTRRDVYYDTSDVRKTSILDYEGGCRTRVPESDLLPFDRSGRATMESKKLLGRRTGHGKSTKVVPQYNRCLASITKS
jgi:hypothetical protein